MPVFIQLSKTDGKYHPMEVSILVEVFKLVVCLCAWSWQKRQDAKDHTSRVRDDGEMIDQFNFRSSLDYAFPAVMFQLGNNMVFFMMMVMDPVTFQLLSNVEILVVALLQRHWMHRILTPKQWLSLVLLVDGVISAELAGGKKVAKVGGGELGPAGIVQAVDSSTGAVTGDTLQHDMFIKYGMVVLIALMRAIGGVGSEYVLKKHSSDSITFQNAQIYAYGILANLVFLAFHYGCCDVSLSGLEHLWAESSISKAFWIALVVLNNSGQGLTIPVVFKYLNNIVKVYINSTALILTTLLSVYLFDFRVSGQFFLGTLTVLISAIIYSSEKAEVNDELEGTASPVRSPMQKHQVHHENFDEEEEYGGEERTLLTEMKSAVATSP